MSAQALKRGNELDKSELPPKGSYAEKFVKPLEASTAKKKKIAIIGTAPQHAEAPYDNPDWEIWCIFGSFAAKRCDKLFEIHDKEIIVSESLKAITNPGAYWEKAQSLGKNYITKDHFDECPDASRFDFQSKLDKYGHYFASSAAWLIAEAIDYGAEEIGLYGINMAHDSEYGYQKPSCTYMLGFARAKGIKVTLPKTSELLAVPFQYGIQQPPKSLMIIDAKIKEVEAQLNAHKHNKIVSDKGEYAMEQSLVILNWVKNNRI